YDAEKHQVALTVKQTQRVENNVGIFSAPVDVEVTTASGPKLYTAHVSKAVETFTFPADSAPVMVLFDKGGYLLKSAKFHKEKKEWLYQLQHATEFSDRADAIVALDKIKNDDEVVAALSTSLNSDASWSIRSLDAQALGNIGGASAYKHLLASLDTNKEPAVRYSIVASIGNFKDTADVPAKLQTIASTDSSYRARAAALAGLGRTKPADALTVLTAAVNADSPDDILRNSALRSLGYLGNDKAVALLVDWSKPGKPVDSRSAAIASLARLDKQNKEITQQIASYLNEPYFNIRWSVIHALGARGDASAVPALEALLKRDDLSIEMVPEIKDQIERLQQPKQAKDKPSQNQDEESADSEDDNASTQSGKGASPAITNRLDHLEDLIEQMSQRLKSMESRLPSQPQQH
ncbi:MAG: HEAT repeat domain-containing protein, partial [Acidobacteria bacterium]|nr:HEAT repeat domain-containing protein [Acidobacteriota bacterium]